MKTLPDIAREATLRELSAGEISAVSGAGDPPCETYHCFYVGEELVCGYVLDAEEFC